MNDHDFLFTAEKIDHRLQLIESVLFQKSRALAPWRYRKVDAPNQINDEFWSQTDSWTLIEPHSYWGAWETNFCLNTELVIPSDWPDSHCLQLYLPMGEAGDFFSHPEMLLTINGECIGSADRHHHVIQLPTNLPKDKRLTVHAVGWTGLSSWPPEAELKTQLYMRPCLLVQRHKPGFRFVHLARSALETAGLKNCSQETRQKLLDYLNHAIFEVDLRDPLGGETYFESLETAYRLLRDRLERSTADRKQQTIFAIGHAHIDVAYLWRIEQTRGKVQRTFSNALALMRQDPDYRFTHTSPLLYQMCQQDNPEMFAEVQDRINEGRWEASAAMWVESDCNLAGAESLVRQFTLARRYNDRFFDGKDSRTLFLPDTFGFCASLPQLAIQAGIDSFVFSKLNWNQTNPFPHSFFEWEGLDGSRLFSHLLTTPRDVAYLPVPSTYKAEMTAYEVHGSCSRCKEPDMPVMIAYGYGNGGGGPSDALVASAHAYKSMPGQRSLVFGRLDEFMSEAKACATTLPIHRGELYLELHRGTFTSQGKIKRANRKNEALLLESEAFCALARWHHDAPYPADSFESIWRKYCTLQFHDILPGSAITSVFDDAMAEYAAIEIDAEALIQAALQNFSESASTPSMPSHASSVRLFPTVVVTETDSNVKEGPRSHMTCHQRDGKTQLSNSLVSVSVDQFGQITSYRHAELGEMLIPGQVGNQWIAFEDRPLMWDAWDIDPFFEEKSEIIQSPTTITLIHSNDNSVAVKVERVWRNSQITQMIALQHDSARLDFDTTVDWHEQHVLLKACFPVQVHTDQARYHIPFGWIERSTDRKCPQARAQFEVSAHYWADISDQDRAIALLNDCKYGYDISQVAGGNQMRLSLIKSSTLPDLVADQGHHRFKYSLFPHAPSDTQSLWDHGYAMNRPARRLGQEYHLPTPLLPILETDGLFVEAVLWSSLTDSLQVRLYEPNGESRTRRLVFAQEVEQVFQCTITESDPRSLDISEGAAQLACRGFEVITLLLFKRHSM